METTDESDIQVADTNLSKTSVTASKKSSFLHRLSKPFKRRKVNSLCLWIEISIFHIAQDIRVSVILTTFFGHITGSTGPILLTSKKILSATKFPIMLVNIIFSVSVIFLEIFSKNNDPSFKTEQRSSPLLF